MAAGAKATYAAPAVQKTFEILELLEAHPAGLLVSEMAVLLGRSVGELFRIVIVVEQLGYLRKSLKDDRYSVAYKLLDLAYRATPAHDLVDAARPVMRRLAVDTGQSCHLVVLNEGSGLVIAREHNPGTRGFALRLGATVDLLASCSGKVLLAFAAAETRTAAIARAVAEGHAVERGTLERQLAQIRTAGHAQRKSPITLGVTDISYPVFGFDGLVAAALTIPFLRLIDGSQQVDIDAARALLADAAAAVTRTLTSAD
ncbi:IclR family transcriptional regulator [Sphingomonas sp. BK235]|jgi:DNA-binding IclR family transcriptional regulator|uniref:IclR family transcriptional regulator n=1 Tax=Sphingomonas sp. BK235 TaxID=2512131 RepID=UPI00104811A7|nr:IclR family transcriptional regulator [Sphingomonas sp. BK235]TCP33703.1 IclR family transcriptional regulator [Sphingomonas sp. BK235]